MNYFEWKKSIIEDYQKLNFDKMSRSGIQPIIAHDKISNLLISNNVFGTNDNQKFFNTFYNNDETAIVVGYGGNSNLHIGHLQLVKEIILYLKLLDNPKLYFVNLEFNQDNLFVNKIMKLINNLFGNVNYDIIGFQNYNANILKQEISNYIKVGSINRVMGWKNENLISYDKVLNMLATFLIGNILTEKSAIIITDINQRTYYSLLSIIKQRFNFKSSIFCYHTLMQSLISPDERMSIKNPKSLIFLDDDYNDICKKLNKSYTGIDEKQRTCSLLKIADIALTNDELEPIISNCISRCNNCKECKQNVIPLVSNNLVLRRVK